MKCNNCGFNMRTFTQKIQEPNGALKTHKLGFCDRCQNRVDYGRDTNVTPFFVIGAILFVLIIGGLSGGTENASNNESTAAVVDNNDKNIPNNTNVETQTEPPTESEADYKASCQTYNYKDVLRNPENYVGKRIKITVKISTVHEQSLFNPEKYYFAYSDNDGKGWYYDDRYGIFDKRADGSMKLLEDDIITVYGEISDPQHTASIIVSSSEVFCIDMKYIDFISE